MTFLDFLLIASYGYLCYRVGWTAREIVAKRAVDKMLENAIIEGDDEEDDIVRIYFEKDQETIFAYNYDTDEFIAQGATKESLLNAMVQRYPKTKFIVEKEILNNLS